MKSLFFMLMFLSSTLGWAGEIRLGEVTFEVPDPEGYSHVVPEMVAVSTHMKTFTTPDNVGLAAYIADNHVQRALQNELPPLDRHFSIQTPKIIANLRLSSNDFRQLKEMMKTETEAIVRQVAEDGEMGAAINDGAKKELGTDWEMEVNQMVPLGVHLETDRMLSYSFRIQMSVTDPQGNSYTEGTIVTMTFVHLKGRVIVLYCHGNESDLEWSRSASKQWAEAVLAANS